MIGGGVGEGGGGSVGVGGGNLGMGDGGFGLSLGGGPAVEEDVDLLGLFDDWN